MYIGIVATIKFLSKIFASCEGGCGDNEGKGGGQASATVDDGVQLIDGGCGDDIGDDGGGDGGGDVVALATNRGGVRLHEEIRWGEMKDMVTMVVAM